MSLQVWLPLNGSIKNQGLNDVTVTNNGATINNSGKIGQCYQFGTAASDITLSANAMTSITTECSICFWIKILSWNTSYATFFQAGTASTAWAAYRFGFLRNNANSTCCFTISNGSTASNASYLTSALELNTWYHIGLCYKTGHCLIYINGILYQDYTTSIVPAFSGITTIKIGRCTTGSNYQTNCLMNDFRIYNHCLSQKEVEEISKGLVLHYKFNTNNIVNKNLLSNFDTSFLSYNIGATTLFSNQMNSGVQEIVANIAGAEKCLHLHSNGGQNRVYRTMSVSQGKIYTLSLDYYSITAKNKAQFGQLHGGDYTAWPETNSSNYTTPGAWQRLTYTFGPLTSDTKLYFYILCDNGADCYIKNIKIEEGPIMTLYINSSTNVISDNNLIIYDSSGYQNNSILNSNITISSNTARYNTSSYFGNYNEPNAILQNTNILPVLSNCTICWWGKYDTTKTLLLTGQNTSIYLAASNANTFYHAAAGSPVMYKNGVQGTYSCIAGTWDFYVLKNVNLSSWTTMKINSYSSEWPLKGYISDFRIYATALTDDQIKELYNTSVTIDNKGNIYSREYIEDNNNLNITKTGLFQSSIIHDDDDLTIASILKTEKQIQGNTLYEY